MWENVDQNNSEYGHFLCSVKFKILWLKYCYLIAFTISYIIKAAKSLKFRKAELNHKPL